MSIIRRTSTRRFSDSTDAMYVYLTERIDWSMGDPSDPEDFCEVMFRVLEQGGTEVDLEMVNGVRDRLGMEPLDDIETRDGC